MARGHGKYPQLADREWLLGQYEHKTSTELAEMIGCSPAAVQMRLKQYGATMRGRHYGRWQDKQCERCGNSYTPSGPSQRFCSKVCQAGTRECANCGREFPLTPTQVRKGVAYPRKYCSDECRLEGRHKEAQLRYRDGQGYIEIPTGTRRTEGGGYTEINIGAPGPNGGRVKEHRWVMEQRLGRPLFPHEEVHHRNGDKSDNDTCPNCPPLSDPPRVGEQSGHLECDGCGWYGPKPNLELWTRSQPRGQRVEDKIEWATWFLAQYGYQVSE